MVEADKRETCQAYVNEMCDLIRAEGLTNE
jgi:hypothetical protein